MPYRGSENNIFKNCEAILAKLAVGPTFFLPQVERFYDNSVESITACVLTCALEAAHIPLLRFGMEGEHGTIYHEKRMLKLLVFVSNICDR